MQEVIREYKHNINKDENFEKILEELKPTINRIIYTNMTDKERAAYGIDDLQQEGYITIYKCLDKFKMDAGVKFKTYFYKAFLNRIRNIKLSKQLKSLLTEQDLECKIIERKYTVNVVETTENNIFFNEMNNFIINVLLSDEVEQEIYKLRFEQKLKYKIIQRTLAYKYNHKISITKIHFLCKKIVEKIQNNWQLLT
jgi:RNA polymerase sigma factor (sigma-70 family)